jgi:Arc/MetJ-type ribon-helix-helix transcriptional regulator
MMKSMTKRVKIAVSLPEELVADARRAVKSGRAASVSAYVAEALQRRSSREHLLADIDESLERSGGPLTPEELAWAEAVLNG